MKQNLLRNVLLLDAAVLFLLGALMIFVPRQVELAFQFSDLPQGVHYILGLWGSVLVTMALGYAIAARDPVRHVVWVQVGIARGGLECIVGAAYLARGIVTFQQAGFGVALAALITLAYIVLYPREAGPRAGAA